METKREKFVRIVENRTNKIIDMLRLLGNCANKSNYDYTDADVQKIFGTLEKELKAYRKQNAGKLAKDIADSGVEKDGIAYMASIADVDNPGLLRELAVNIIKEKGEGVVVLGAAFGEKSTVLALCSPKAVAAGIKAGAIVSELAAKLGGKGGGKPDFAQGGGHSENLKKVFDEYKAALK